MGPDEAHCSYFLPKPKPLSVQLQADLYTICQFACSLPYRMSRRGADLRRSSDDRIRRRCSLLKGIRYIYIFEGQVAAAGRIRIRPPSEISQGTKRKKLEQRPLHGNITQDQYSAGEESGSAASRKSGRLETDRPACTERKTPLGPFGVPICVRSPGDKQRYIRIPK